ncbi:hypothetical protein Asp14428_48050 [Actinoplanes sp. NBRC 14428]|nr:hypothetical protein Asp14428_48050 [Actinoplanes sp. NBRC 14428]
MRHPHLPVIRASGEPDSGRTDEAEIRGSGKAPEPTVSHFECPAGVARVKPRPRAVRSKERYRRVARLSAAVWPPAYQR